ncbi:MAG: YdcH family protein [Gammaproteobacteria bacterium]|nr:YdcH family protein [Gammaproteobacteria bacterium]
MDDERNTRIKARLQELQLEHRALDDVVERLSEAVHVDQLQLRRLKKRKLFLKDQIERYKSMLIPDLDA